MRKFFFMLLVLVSLGLASCGQNKVEVLQVGIIEGLGQDIMEQVQAQAASQGFAFEIVVFKDYIEINTALKQKKIHLNCFQNQYWLDKVNRERQTDFAAVGKTYLSPMGAYSLRHKAIAENAGIALPNDAVSQARALSLLAKSGYIKLRDTGDFLPDVEDIVQNDSNLIITTVDSAEIRASLQEQDIVFLGLNYALSIGLHTSDALLLENPSSQFTQLIVTRRELKNDKNILKFIQFYHSEQTKKYILENYGNNLLPAW